MTEPDSYDAREGSGDSMTDPAAMGEERLDSQDGDGGAVPDEDVFPEPGTGESSSASER
jgi:hypothetical protein